MTSPTTKTGNYTQDSAAFQQGIQIPFDAINQPGCYVCNWSGHLLRVPEDGVAPGRSPLINIVGQQPLFVTKISVNPFIPVTKARMLASNCDLAVNF